MQIVILFMTLSVLCILVQKSKEGYTPTPKVQCVVATYKEDLAWTQEEPFKDMDIVVYNKGNRWIDAPVPRPNFRIESLPNVGRCDHTYLHHIIENYDSLAPVTIFMQGSWQDVEKRQQTLDVIRRVKETGTSVVPLWDAPADIQSFSLDEWTSTNAENKSYNLTSKLDPSPHRPYGVWFKHNFPDDTLDKVHYKAIFAVSREHIHNRSKEFYQKLIKYLDGSSNPEAGHYVERSWGKIFSPMPPECTTI